MVSGRIVLGFVILMSAFLVLFIEYRERNVVLLDAYSEPRDHRLRTVKHKQCTRQDHVVYIKTHKTASTTIASMMYRLAFRRNLSSLCFRKFPYPDPSFFPYMLNNDPSLHKLPHIDMAADHIVYNREEFQQVMPKDTVYISSLREPVSQFKSIINYFKIPKRIGLRQDYPVEVMLGNLEKHFPNGTWQEKFIRNRNSKMLGLNPKDQMNLRAIREFVDKTLKTFKHMIFSEYFDESLVVMRRKLCWEISDILYLPVNVANYRSKSAAVKEQLVENLRKWSNVDAMLYDTYNNTFWNELSGYDQEFWKELEFFQNQEARLFNFCKPVISKKILDPIRVLESLDFITIPESPWGKQYRVDYIWCLMSKIHTLTIRNIIRVHQYPELCNNSSRKRKNLSLKTFKKSRFSKEVEMNPAFCSDKKTSTNSTFHVPIDVLLKATRF